ncbi:MAG: hypothetical protein KF819_34445 [Labilithrix sp.]|nr:hypothetical protein [Labilithrix sp.]
MHLRSRMKMLSSLLVAGRPIAMTLALVAALGLGMVVASYACAGTAETSERAR